MYGTANVTSPPPRRIAITFLYIGIHTSFHLFVFVCLSTNFLHTPPRYLLLYIYNTFVHMYILHTEMYLTYKSCTCSNWNFQDKKKENNVDGTYKSRSNKIELNAALPTRRDVFSLTALPITIVGARNVVYLCMHHKPCYARIHIRMGIWMG